MSNYRYLWRGLVVAAVTVFAVLALSSGARETVTPTLQPENSFLGADGRVIYDAQCASCHGKNLEGQPNWRQRDAEGYLPAPPHDETGHIWHHSDKVLFDLTKHGLVKLTGQNYKTRMPAYDGVLSDREIIAVLSYLKSRWPKNIRTRHDKLNEARRKKEHGAALTFH